MAQFQVVEAYEEVAYKMRPPLLEDVSIEGPLRIPIPHALDTIEQRDAIEEDYNWWRYSKMAAPFLFILLLIFALIFTSTAFQQAGTLKELRNGTPRYYQLEVDSKKRDEGGLQKKGIRNVRIAAVWCALLPAILAFAVLGIKPRPKLRKVLMFLLALILFAGAVLAIIAFAIAEDDSRQRARRCTELGKQNNPPFNYQIITNEDCEDRTGIAEAALALDFLLFASSLTAVVALVLTTASGDFKLLRTGWRQQERDLEQEPIKVNKFNIKAHRVRETRLAMTSVALLFVIGIGIAYAAFIIVLSQDNDKLRLRSWRGRTSIFFDDPPINRLETEGWSARNTRLRYAWSAIGILTVLINFIPWRSRVIAWIFFILYFIVGVMAFVSFGLDVSELRRARRFGCPSNPYRNLLPQQVTILAFRNSKVNCVIGPYVSTCFWEFVVGVLIIFYLLNEYIIRFKSVHSQRKYPWFAIHKQETKLDSRRPVRCELTSQTMTAKEYYYRHRFLDGAGLTSSGSSASAYAESLWEAPFVGGPLIAPQPIYAPQPFIAY
jgi:hypothetical protein